VADNESGQEKTEEATSKKRDDSRKKGDVPRSRELTTAMILFGGVAGFTLTADHFFSGLGGLLTHGFSPSRAQIFDPDFAYAATVTAGLTGLGALAPILMILTVIAIIGPVAIGGWSLNPSASVPQFSRMDPVQGLKKVFGLRGLIELLKSLAKFVLILGFGLTALYFHFGEVSQLGLRGIEPALADSAHIILQIFIFSATATLVIAVIDVPYQLWEHSRKLRMTRQELKDESKQQEGSPELRGRIRNLQQDLANRRMMEEVPKADVVITNPTHYAVALTFDTETMNAPRLVAKGADHMALRIREAAAAAGVTILSAPPLARSIYNTTKLNREIPPGLYVAVAQVLAYVFQLKRNPRSGRDRKFDDLPIPSELRY